jgi:hypothetical protein
MSAARKPRRSMEDLLREQRALDDTPAATPAGGAPSGPVAVDALPEPYLAPENAGGLTTREHADLATCEAALDNLRVAFWAAGKALQVVRDARLYRDTHATFEDYLQQRWDMSRAQAYRLIEAWPLAERLSPIGDKINESQVRELLPLASRHGQDAAVTVYRTIAEAGGGQVTAALLHGAVSILPDDHFDPAEAAEQIRAYLAGTYTTVPPPARSPVEAFTSDAARMLQVLRRVTARGTLTAAVRDDPEAVKRVIADMRKVLDEMERAVT